MSRNRKKLPWLILPSLAVLGLMLSSCGTENITANQSMQAPALPELTQENPLEMTGRYRLTVTAEKTSPQPASTPAEVNLTGIIDLGEESCSFYLNGTILNYDDRGRDLDDSVTDTEWAEGNEKPPYVQVPLKLFKTEDSPVYSYTQESPNEPPAWSLYTALPTSPGVSPAEYALQYPAVDPAYNPYGWCSLKFLPWTIDVGTPVSDDENSTVTYASPTPNSAGLNTLHERMQHEATLNYLKAADAKNILSPRDYAMIYGWVKDNQYAYPRRDLITPTSITVDGGTSELTLSFTDVKGLYNWTVNLLPEPGMGDLFTEFDTPREEDLPSVLFSERFTPTTNGDELLFSLIQGVNSTGTTCYEKSVHFLTSYNNYAGIPRHIYSCISSGNLI